MRNFSKYIIPDTYTIRESLSALNNLSNDSLTLFVADVDAKIVGTITDGDIRRSILAGFELSDRVMSVMNTNFSFITKDDKTIVNKIQSFRNRNINLIPILDKNHKLFDIINLKLNYSALPLDVVLMAGGKGERLRPLTENTPKPLLKLGDKSIIDHNIQRLRSFGVRNIYVTVNYLKEQLIDHFRDDDIQCITEPTFLGTFGAVKLIKDFHSDYILVMNSDIFTNINFENFFLSFLESNASLSIAAVSYQVNIPYGIFEFENDGESLLKIKEKPVYNYFANAGIYLLKRSLVDLIPDHIFFNADDFINQLIANKEKVTKFPISGYWIDIGKHEDFAKAKELVKYI